MKGETIDIFGKQEQYHGSDATRQEWQVGDIHVLQRHRRQHDDASKEADNMERKGEREGEGMRDICCTRTEKPE